MLNAVVKWSIAQRWLVVIASILILLWGFRVLTQSPLDVFPNFAPPQVEIQTEATGLALTLLVLPALYSQFGKYIIPKSNLDRQVEVLSIQESIS